MGKKRQTKKRSKNKVREIFERIEKDVFSTTDIDDILLQLGRNL